MPYRFKSHTRPHKVRCKRRVLMAARRLGLWLSSPREAKRSDDDYNESAKHWCVSASSSALWALPPPHKPSVRRVPFKFAPQLLLIGSFYSVLDLFPRRMSSSVTPKRWEAVKSTGRWVEFLRQTLVIRQSLPGNRLLYRFCETKRKRLIHRTLYEFHFSTNMKGGTEEEKGDHRRTHRAATVKWDFLRTGGINYAFFCCILCTKSTLFAYIFEISVQVVLLLLLFLIYFWVSLCLFYPLWVKAWTRGYRFGRLLNEREQFES